MKRNGQWWSNDKVFNNAIPVAWLLMTPIHRADAMAESTAFPPCLSTTLTKKCIRKFYMAHLFFSFYFAHQRSSILQLPQQHHHDCPLPCVPWSLHLVIKKEVMRGKKDKLGFPPFFFYLYGFRPPSKRKKSKSNSDRLQLSTPKRPFSCPLVWERSREVRLPRQSVMVPPLSRRRRRKKKMWTVFDFFVLG